LYALLVSLLKDESSEVRAAAAQGIKTLGKLEDPDDVLSALASESEKRQPLRSVVIPLLDTAADHKIRLPERLVRNLMSSADTYVRQHCAYVVAQTEDERKMPLLIDALADKDDGIRGQAVKALIEMDDPGARAKLAEVARNSSVQRQRVAAIGVLAKINDASIYPLLAELLKGDNAVLRNAAAEAVESLNIREGFSLIVNVFAGLPDKKRDRRFTGIALKVAAAHGLAIPFEVATKLLESPDGTLQKSCIAAVGSARIKELVPLLIKSLGVDRYDSYGVREETAKALGLIGDVQAINPLLELLKNAPIKIAHPAALALIRLGAHDEVAAFLMSKDKSKDWASRQALVTFIGTSKAIEAVPFLIGALEYADDVVKMMAAKSLGLIGAPQAIGPLIKMARTESSAEVKADAVAALILIHLKTGTFQYGVLSGLIKAAIASPYYEVKMAAAASLIMVRHVHGEDFDGNTCKAKDSIEKYSAEASGGIYKIPYLFPQPLLTEDDDSQFTAAKNMSKEIMKLSESSEFEELLKAAEAQEYERQFGDIYISVMLKIVAGHKVGVPKEEISRLFGSEDDLTRQSSAFALGLLGDTEVLPYLVESLGAQDEDVRRAAVYAVANNADSNVRQRLTELAAGDPDASVRAAATEVLAGGVTNAGTAESS
jgi:HEAT repeat protein